MKKLNLAEYYLKHADLFRIRLRHKPRFMKLISWILMIAILNLTNGCANYFKVTTVPAPAAEKLDSFYKQGKVIILHLKDRAWIFESPAVSGDMLTGIAAKEYVSTYDKTIKDRGNRYQKSKKNNQSYLLNEVHIYTTEVTQLPESRVSIPLSKIEVIELYKKDMAPTVATHILGYSAIIVPTVIIVWIILAITNFTDIGPE